MKFKGSVIKLSSNDKTVFARGKRYFVKLLATLYSSSRIKSIFSLVSVLQIIISKDRSSLKSGKLSPQTLERYQQIRSFCEIIKVSKSFFPSVSDIIIN